ncbi:MAG: hypothetical protein LLF98_04750 [Clostridium sp.]|nr:hypothetical protein [Clostridium sp.]MCE5220583.1 hypothetical protein [Clostridium sp.]
MVILSLVFLAFIGINIASNSMKTRQIHEYMKEIETEISNELKIIK